MWPSHGTAQATNFDELKHCCIKTLFPPLFSPGRPCLPGSQEKPRSTIRNLVSGVECRLHKAKSGNTPSVNFQKLHSFVSNLQFCRQASVLEQWDFFLLHFRNAPLPPLSIQGSRVAKRAALCGQRALPTVAVACPGACWSWVRCPMATGVLAGTPQLKPLTEGQRLSAAEVHMLSLPAALSRRTGNLLTICRPSHTLGSIGCKVTPEIPWASKGICTSW